MVFAFDDILNQFEHKRTFITRSKPDGMDATTPVADHYKPTDKQARRSSR